MRERIITIISYLHGALLLLALLPVLAYISSRIEGSMSVIFVRMLLVYVPYLAISLSAEYCRSFFIFLPVSLLSAAVLFLFPMSIVTRVFLLLLTVFIFAVKLSGRIRGANDLLNSPHLATLILFAAAFLFGLFTEDSMVQTVSYWGTFVYALSWMIFTNSGRMEEYLTINEGVANIPYRQIRRTNYGMIGIYLLFSVTAMLLLPHSGLDRLLMKFVDALKALFRILIQHLPAGNKETSPPVSEEPPMEQEMPSLEGVLPPDTTPEWVKIVLDGIFYAVFIVIMLFFAVALGKAIVRMVKKFYKPYQENDDEQEFLSPLEERQSLKEIISSVKPLWMDFSPNAAVRKVYRKSIEKKGGRKKASGDLRTKTPEEIENHVGLENSENRALLHTLYEKARYSKEGVTKEEARSVR